MQVKNRLDLDTIIKILKGAAIAGGGVALIHILEALSVMDFGDFSAVATALCMVLINAIREYLKGE